MDIVLLIAAVGLVGLGLGYFFAKKAANVASTGVNRKEYDAVVAERITLTARLEAANEDKKSLSNTLEQVRRELTETRERAVMLKTEKTAIEQQRNEQAVQFESMAAKLLENVSNKFSAQSEKQIGTLLDPLKTRLTDFQKLVTDSFTTQGKEQFSLKAEIDKFIQTSDAMRLETGNLAKALRGDVKAQGNWGEVILERILEAAGLRKGIEYIAQGAELELADDDGNRQRPDYIINLPENKHIIIDSKVSLASYDRYCNEQNDDLKAVHLKDFLKSIRSHITGLSEKRYHDLKKLNSPDFVFMFMPIEGAYSLAMQHDPELQDYTWNKKITLVCPGTLHPSMRIVSLLWSIERQNKHTEEIARQGGALYDKFHGFITDMQDIGDQMKKLDKVYDSAMNKLSEGKGNLINRVENLRKLGVKVSKPLPQELLNEEDSETDAYPLPVLAES